MRPMFSYYGSKYRLAKLYGPPQSDLVIEPFAGSAAYSLFWEPKRVILADVDPTIVSIWEYLISVSEDEILALPTKFTSVAELDVSDAAKKFIGFWIGKGKATPGITKSKWTRQYEGSGDCKVWGEPVKARVAKNLHKIRHWEIMLLSYKDIPNVSAHWFIDPPYQIAGSRYKFNKIDYIELGTWCQTRNGHVQVCENEGATWLPFDKFSEVRSQVKDKSYSKEVLWTKTAIPKTKFSA